MEAMHMNGLLSPKPWAPALSIVAMLLSAPAPAEKPEWAGKGGKHAQKSRAQDAPASGAGKRDGASVHVHFGDQHRGAVRDYYESKHREGFCPPGLARKRNGCMPPGQAKKWSMGRPLPREVVFHELPAEIVVRIGPPPSGHRYVRVATDILLIAIGTGIVVDAIRDLGRI
jgi:Ni/Co efflux regulator RcnB